jgi:hypothetical protein
MVQAMIQGTIQDRGLLNDAGAPLIAQPIGWREHCTLARQAGKRLCTGVRASLAARRRRRVAAVMYAQLSKLSEDELQWRGLSPADVHRLAAEKDER